MTRRELVKAAIAHRATPRVPYFITFTTDGEKRLQERIAPRRVKEFVDNDVVPVPPPWWSWVDLGPDWRACRKDLRTAPGSFPGGRIRP